MLEKEIESKLVSEVRKRGGLCWKFTSPGRSGVPDRVVLYKGVCWFVELKAPGQRPRPLQQQMFMQLGKQGFPVMVISSEAGVMRFVKDMEEVRGCSSYRTSISGKL